MFPIVPNLTSVTESMQSKWTGLFGQLCATSRLLGMEMSASVPDITDGRDVISSWGLCMAQPEQAGCNAGGGLALDQEGQGEN